MPRLQILYKQTKTGKTQTWQMEIDGEKYRTISGQLNGKQVTSEWTTCLPKNVGKKNELSSEAQAKAEVEAKYVKKRETYVDDLEESLKGNTGFREPMLAEDYDRKHVVFPGFMQPKLDGIRCLASSVSLLSRKNKLFKACPHISEALKPVFKKYPKAEVDGEFYNHTLKHDFDRLTQLVKKQKPTVADLAESEKIMEFHCFDIRGPDISHLPFQSRSKLLATLLDTCASKKLVFVETDEVNSFEELDTLYKRYLKAGYEGGMYRKNDEYQDTRTYSLLKRKELKVEEFEIVDVLEGKGNRSGMCGKLVLRLKKPTKDGKTTVEANPKGNRAFYKRLLLEREQVIGKMAVVEFQNYTPKGSLRFPRAKGIRDYE